MADPNADLQFDRAQFETPRSAVCATCQRPLSGSYFEINGRLACELCRMQAESDWNNSSGVSRFLRATALGTLAAIAGAAVYYGVTVLADGKQFSLLSIGVGILVGVAVRIGSRGRGGWPYQLLAMFLTYTSIVSTYSPEVLKGFSESSARPSGLALVVIAAVIYISPFLMLMSGQGVIIAIIIGIGVWQAWKLNRKTGLQIAGPFSLSTRPAPAPPAA